MVNVNTAVREVYNQFNDCIKNQSKHADEGILVMMEDDTNVLVWTVLLANFPTDSLLAQDMKKWGESGKEDFIKLEIEFPATYPTNPPFIRVLAPRFQFHTGHVTIGGSLCIESLVNTGTPTGWQTATSIWAILVQCKQLILDGGGRIDFRNPHPYTKQEAQAAFTRVAGQHGWISGASHAHAPPASSSAPPAFPVPAAYKPMFPAACNPWWDQNQTGTLAMINLPGVDPQDNGIGSMRHKEAVAIAKIFTDRWGQKHNMPTIVAITRIQNLRVFDKFYMKLLELTYIAKPNEKWMFHGLRSPENAHAIVEHGFDARVSERGFLGAGIYCAENSDLAHRYTNRDSTGTRYCLYGRVMLGETEQVPVDGSMPTYRRGHKYTFFHQGENREITRNYDSESSYMGGAGLLPFSVIFSNEQAYPDYVISYKLD